MPVHVTKADGRKITVNRDFVVSIEPSKQDPEITYVQTNAGLIEVKGKYESVLKKFKMKGANLGG